MQFDLDLLRTLVTVMRSGSYTSAGAMLGRTQPAISLQMKRLEERLGAPVLVRDGRKIGLTSAGEVLHAYAQQILSLHDEAVSRLTLPTVVGYVRLGVMEELGFRALPKVLASFVRTFADANLDLRVKSSEVLLVEMAHGRLDFAFATADENTPGALPAWRESLVWAGEETGRVRLTPAGRVPIVALPEPSRHRQLAIDALAQAGWKIDVVCTASTMIGVRAAAAAGIGIAAVGRGDLEAGLRRIGHIDGHPLPALPEVQISLYSHSEAAGELSHHLIEHVRKNI